MQKSAAAAGIAGTVQLATGLQFSPTYGNQPQPYGQPPQFGDEPPASGPPAYGPPAYGPPASGPPASGPPASGPPAYGPPAHGQGPATFGQSPYAGQPTAFPPAADLSDPPTSRTGLWVTLALVVVILLGGLATAAVILIRNDRINPTAAGPGGSSAPATPTPKGTGPAPATGTVHLSTPKTVGKLKLSDEADMQVNSDTLKQQIAADLPGATDSMGGVFQDPADPAKIVLVVAVTGRVSNPREELDSAFTGPDKYDNVHSIDPGPLGGLAKCGSESDIHGVTRAWADVDNLGMVFFLNRSRNPSGEPVPAVSLGGREQ